MYIDKFQFTESEQSYAYRQGKSELKGETIHEHREN